ncbi:hypothetical protein ACU4GD_22770 [Cupriavidus basilensis]
MVIIRRPATQRAGSVGTGDQHRTNLAIAAPRLEERARSLRRDLRRHQRLCPKLRRRAGLRANGDWNGGGAAQFRPAINATVRGY